MQGTTARDRIQSEVPGGLQACRILRSVPLSRFRSGRSASRTDERAMASPVPHSGVRDWQALGETVDCEDREMSRTKTERNKERKGQCSVLSGG